jgi:hypothetical protein
MPGGNIKTEGYFGDISIEDNIKRYLKGTRDCSNYYLITV